MVPLFLWTPTMNILHIDFESYSEADIQKTGAYVYSEHASTEILCMSYAFNNDPVVHWFPKKDRDYSDFPAKVRKHLTSGGLYTAHNAVFEWCMLKNVLGIETDPRNIRDTMLQLAVRALPQSLDKGAEALGSYPKSKEGKLIMLQLCKPKKPSIKCPESRYTKATYPEKYAALYAYCDDDVEAQRGIYDELPKPTKDEQRIYELVFAAGAKGLPIDGEAIDCMLEAIDAEKEVLTARCMELTGLAPTQREKLRVWLWDRGTQLDNMTGTTLTPLLNSGTLDPVHQELLEIYQSAGKSSTSKYIKIQQTLCSDDTIKFTMVSHGAKTGRTTGKDAQTANLPRPVIKNTDVAIRAVKLDPLNIGSMFDSVMAVASSCIRGMIAAPAGYQFLQGDYSQIEARVLAWGAGQEDSIKRFRQGADPYMALATTIYRTTLDRVTPPQRQIAKSAVLGAGFQMGGAAFVKYCLNSGIVIEEDEAKRVINQFRAANQRIVDFWGAAQECALAAIKEPHTVQQYRRFRVQVRGDFMYIILPSGREIAYHRPHIVNEHPTAETAIRLPDWKPPSIRFYGVDSKTHQYSKQKTYGGDLVQAWTQATARDLLMHGWDLADKRGFDIRLTVYDELLALEPIGGRSHESLCKVMTSVPSWASGIPIEAEGWTGGHYRK